MHFATKWNLTGWISLDSLDQDHLKLKTKQIKNAPLDMTMWDTLGHCHMQFQSPKAAVTTNLEIRCVINVKRPCSVTSSCALNFPPDNKIPFRSRFHGVACCWAGFEVPCDFEASSWAEWFFCNFREWMCVSVMFSRIFKNGLVRRHGDGHPVKFVLINRLSGQTTSKKKLTTEVNLNSPL